ncbi:MAG: histidine phosphatase family protein, partial [Dehalococcoidia bacterium]
MRGSSDTRLILVKHSLPDVDPAVPAARWRLSEEGRQRCLPLANQLAAYQPAAIIASTEPKATETAELVARHLHLPFTTAAGLHEHDRSSTAFLGPEEFQRAVQKFFRQRDTLVLGQETANQAEERFTAAVMEVLQPHPQK